MAEQIKINVPLDSLKDEVCSCGNGLWLPALQLKIVPPLYSQTGKHEYLMMQVGFLCTNCGNRIGLKPVIENKSNIVTFPGREN